MNVKSIAELGGGFFKNPISFLYSIWFNLRYLRLHDAIRMPMLVSPSIKVRRIKRGSIRFSNPFPFMVRIGLWGTDGIYAHKGYLHIVSGTVTFHGVATISRGFSLKNDAGNISFGKGFFCNTNCIFYNNQHIILGDNCIIGWNCSLRTSDGHSITYIDGHQNQSRGIAVGNHVWIAANSNISKGVEIANDCVVSQNSLVIKSLETPYSIYGGCPAKFIKTIKKWEI